MTPGNNSITTAAAKAGIWRWNSPIAYLFVCLALVLGLITVAMLVLAYSYRKSLNRSSQIEAGEEKPPKQVEIQVVDYEPNVVVIMAGDENPTFLAKPVSSDLQPQVQPAKADLEA